MEQPNLIEKKVTYQNAQVLIGLKVSKLLLHVGGGGWLFLRAPPPSEQPRPAEIKKTTGKLGLDAIFSYWEHSNHKGNGKSGFW
ncbi:hypothetical protein CEXT_441101 [Caerostris extrusa]|uniref:Uncharacterized protein n=1 Tax=Caerostris extrusa TaxID=172846 RepID=A0AAV4NFJ0_CAEEX|nr:hypothetical protein CEXT_441101 [Caerostris extrusa]